MVAGFLAGQSGQGWPSRKGEALVVADQLANGVHASKVLGVRSDGAGLQRDVACVHALLVG